MDERPVVDGTRLSSAELRAQIRDLQDGRDEQLTEARTELATSLAQLDRGMQALRARVGAKVRQAAIVAGGIGAAAAAVAGAAVLARRRWSTP